MRRIIVLALSLSSIALGCAESTTLELDAGMDAATADAGRDATTPPDAPSVDAPPIADAQPPDGPGPETWRSCDDATDCVLEPNDCCGWCGMGRFSDVDAVNRERLEEHAMEVCPEPEPCPLCPGGPLDPQVVATCEARTCRAIDLGTLPLTECTRDDDCVVTYANCCGCSGADDEVVAIRASAGRMAIDALFCAGGFCALDCAPRIPPGWRAVCDAGRCRPLSGG